MAYHTRRPPSLAPIPLVSSIKDKISGKLCNQQHERQPLERANSKGRHTKQAARWTSRLCRCIIEGVQLDLQRAVGVAFAAEMTEENIEEEPHTLDGVYDEDDLPSAKPSPPQVELDLW